MTELPMFPLGSVLFPHMPIMLRVFEERYMVMLSRVLQDEPSEFGVVLIERGQEVGGGEKRFGIGTVATILQLDAEEGAIGLMAQGGSRVTIDEWLDDAPHPRADVTVLDEFEWDDALRPELESAEQLVRRTIARASEFSDQQWPADIQLTDDPVARAWQLAAISPLGALDQMTLLGSDTLGELLDGIIELTFAAEESITALWPDEQDEG